MVSARSVSMRGKLEPWSLSRIHNAPYLTRPLRIINTRSKSSWPQKNGPKTKDSRLQAERRERQFFETILGTSTTKREAKSFLSRFEESKPHPPVTTVSQQHEDHHGKVNLGALYSPYRAIENAPVFTQFPQPERMLNLFDSKGHVAIVKIQDPSSISDDLLSGVAITLCQLARLGVLSLVVLDVQRRWNGSHSLANLRLQCDRIAQVIDSHHSTGARVIDQAFSFKSLVVPGQTPVRLELSSLISSPLQRGLIPVISPLAYSESSDAHIVDSNELVLALARQFASIEGESEEESELSRLALLDRIIFLDESGGIPDIKNQTQSQSFINLEQDFQDIHSQLLSDVLEQSLANQATSEKLPHRASNAMYQLRALECITKCLAILPPSASALLTTANAVADSNDPSVFPSTGVRTRPKRNPLIHNILTDKPMVSSSLPAGRRANSSADSISTSSTVLKRGMPVKVVPDPRFNPWTAPGHLTKSLRLNRSPEIDFSKLQFLIEDSFNRPLDMNAYMERVHGNLAGIIVVGQYEGGSILTWETPPNRPWRPPVPYLDKFAVLKRCQGSGGVADILFNSMVRDCFQNGVVWRSRKTNPVNKWYFERASGVWQIPDTQWTMFWTGNVIDSESAGGEEWKERLEDYIDVCRNIQPNWADTQRPPD
jgi:amino-acid N-acetyltransferase